jgi:uncharacterized protein (TIGR03790 family)
MTRPKLPTYWPPLAAALLVLWLAGCGGGGGGGASAGNATTTAQPPLTANELAVLIAEGDATSEAIGVAYQRARGIPDSQVLRVPVPASGDVISASAFATLKATVDARLPANVQATLVTWQHPSRVAGACTMSLTSALAFGYDTKWCGNCAVTAPSDYYQSTSHRPWTDLRIRPSMMLGVDTLPEAQALIARGLAAEGLVSGGRATGQAWLVRTTDVARSVRFDDFSALARVSLSGVSFHYVDNSAGMGSDVVANQSDLMFYFTGLTTVPQIATNRWLPGAAADHLTSLGGVLPDGGGNNMPATDWLRAGATASYGTVEEPCNFPAKFPRASVLVARYQQGDTLLEAYWKSVQWPGQGLFIGEPLARPWAK